MTTSRQTEVFFYGLHLQICTFVTAVTTLTTAGGKSAKILLVCYWN